MKSSITRIPLAALLAVAACTDAPEGPLGAPAPEGPVQQEGAFYYYGDERIMLDVDPTEISVALDPGAPNADGPGVRAVLRDAGLADAEPARVSFADGHWAVDIGAGRSPAEAVDVVRTLRESGRFGFVANVYRTREARGRVVLMNRVAVRMRDGASRADVERLNAEFGTRVVREPSESQPDVWWLAYPADADPLTLAAALDRHELTRWADPDKVHDRKLHAVPTDPFYAQQYYLRNTRFLNGVRVDINVEPAWDITYGAWAPSAGPLMLAVVDDGVETFHADLSSTTGWGYDATTASWSGWGCTNCALNPGGTYSHGTHVAGIINAEHNNGIGLAGAAPAVQILAIRIFDRNGWPASDANIALAINNAWYNGAQIMNNSWGGDPSTASNTITSAINRATNEGRNGLGTVMVFAAGNPSRRSTGFIGPVGYPGNLSNVLTVSAIDSIGRPADYAPDGSAIDVVAPSGSRTDRCVGSVVTIDLAGAPGCSDGPGGNQDYSSTFSGTSAAAPQAASVAAMILSRNTGWTESQIRSRIKAGADPWGSSTTYGAGKLNAYRALVGRISVSILGNRYPSSPGNQTYTASVSGGAGSYTYRWEKQVSGSTTWSLVSTGTGYTEYVSYDEDFALRLTVTDGPDAHQRSTTAWVYGPYDSTSCTSDPMDPYMKIIPEPCFEPLQ